MRKQDQCGTFTRYKLGLCKCADCTEAHRVYASNRRKQVAYGRWNPFVDAEPVREHVEALKRSGLGRRQIAGHAGVDQCVIYRLDRGLPGRSPTQRMRQATADKILAVTPGLEAMAGAALVDALGTHRRLQALVAVGWPIAELARRLGTLPANMSSLMRRRRVLAAKARAVRDLYEELWDTAPPAVTVYQRRASVGAVRLAASRGWVPPMGWDDIDDPTERPKAAVTGPTTVDLVAVKRALAGEEVPLNHREVAEAVRIGTGKGMSAAQLADATGRTSRSVQRRRAA